MRPLVGEYRASLYGAPVQTVRTKQNGRSDGNRHSDGIADAYAGTRGPIFVQTARRAPQAPCQRESDQQSKHQHPRDHEVEAERHGCPIHRSGHRGRSQAVAARLRCNG
jgi:hypothetical protein